MQNFSLKKKENVLDFAQGGEPPICQVFPAKFSRKKRDHHLTSPGGSISNMYALMIARHKLFPQHKKHGMRAIKGQLIMYTSKHVSSQ
jgi:hypothetical protein